MRPRGLIFIHQFRPVASGAELQAERLAIKLTEMGHPMQVLTQLRTPDSLPEETLHGVRVHRVTFPLAYWIDREVIDTFRYLVQHRHQYDVLHVQQAFGHAVVSVILARCFGKKCIIKIACAGSYGDLNVFSGFNGFESAIKILRQADMIVAISREVEEELLGWGFAANRVRRIPNGVDVDFFQRRMPFPPRQTTRFVLIGRRCPQKGIDLALQAANLLKAQGLSRRFEIKMYGLDYPEYDYYTMAKALDVEDVIEFLPFQEAILDVLHAAHAFILPSRGEGLSNALLEAMAMELPVIATGVSGTVDAVKDGEDGLLIPLDSAEALAEAMSTLIQQPNFAHRLGQQARQKILKSFSLESVSLQYSALYHELCHVT